MFHSPLIGHRFQKRFIYKFLGTFWPISKPSKSFLPHDFRPSSQLPFQRVFYSSFSAFSSSSESVFTRNERKKGTEIRLSGVDFINILRANFLYESALAIFFLVTFWLWNFLAKKYGPIVLSKMLMKLTPGVYFIIILRSTFYMKVFWPDFLYLLHFAFC